MVLFQHSSQPILVVDIFGQYYQLSISSYAPPYSAARERRFSDVESAIRFLRGLRTGAARWRQLLVMVGGRPGSAYSEVDALRACAALAVRGRIRFYPVPRLSSTSAITAEPGWGYAFAPGPDAVPHASSKCLTITTAAEAEALVDRLPPSTSWANILYEAGLKDQITIDAPAANRAQLVLALSQQRILAYKVGHQHRPAAKPVSGDPTAATGPGMRTVPLAPASSPRASVAPATPAEKPRLQTASPQDLDEVEQLLAERRQQIIESGYQQKYTDEQLKAIAAKGEVTDRFLVRLIFGDVTKARGGTLGFRRESGRAPYWATTLDMAEAADSDPEILAGLFGIEKFDPKQPFTLAVIDMEKMPAQAERESFIPTYEKMKAFGEKEFTAKEGFGPNTMAEITNDKFSAEYAAFISDFESEGKSIYNYDAVEDHAEIMTSEEEAQQLLQARHKMQLEFGANPLYSGNGLTKVTPDSRYAEDIGQDYGVVETFTFERDPLTLSELENKGAVKLISATPIRG